MRPHAQGKICNRITYLSLSTRVIATVPKGFCDPSTVEWLKELKVTAISSDEVDELSMLLQKLWPLWR